MIKENMEIRIIDKLKVKIYETRSLMGSCAASDVGDKIKELLANQDSVNIIFAAAPSQNEFLAALSGDEGVDWTRVNAFHMDEYMGLGKNDPNRFGYFLQKRIFDLVPFHAVYYLDGNTEDPVIECLHYADLLRKYPADIVCLGIGENAHLAFNDPHVADFKDPLLVKVVDLAEASRQQQVNDGCFMHLKNVPTAAITLTIPALMQAKYLYCMVPGSNKAQAVYHSLYSDISEAYPSTALRRHANAILYLDKNSSAKL